VKIQYCTKCLNVSTRPGSEFGKDGLCFPCAFKKSKPAQEKVDNDLRRLIEFGKANQSGGYDCVVGVSGGKDSTRQALHIREVFGMNPLLVSMNYPSEQISMLGVQNLTNLVELGFDCVNISLGADTWRKAMRFAFERHGNWAKATEFPLHASAPRIAIAYKIPLVWWGENGATQLGDMAEMSEEPWDATRLKYGNTLSGGGVDWLKESEIPLRKLTQYEYPSDEEIANAGLKIVYMDYFMNDFTNLANGNFAALRGLSVRKPDPTKDADFFGTSMLDENFININMYIRYLKFGFGRASDLVNLEIREGRMSREEGIELVNLYDGSYSQEIVELFCLYIGISQRKFWEVVDRFYDQDLFYKESDGNYIPKFKVGG